MKKSLPSINVTSDWHCGHTACLEYDKRPFRDMAHMERELIKRFNSIVKEGDITYFLGDMGPNFINIRPKLNGKHVLVFGNHDRIGTYAALGAGFSAVLYHGALRFGKHLVTFSHCPLRGLFREDVTDMKGAKEGDNWHGESRHQLFSIKNHGGHHLHGHTHSEKGKAEFGLQLDVSVTAHNYFPVTRSYIESWLHRSLRSQDDQNTNCSHLKEDSKTSS